MQLNFNSVNLFSCESKETFTLSVLLFLTSLFRKWIPASTLCPGSVSLTPQYFFHLRTHSRINPACYLYRFLLCIFYFSANSHSRSLSENGHQRSKASPARHVRHATIPYHKWVRKQGWSAFLLSGDLHKRAKIASRSSSRFSSFPSRRVFSREGIFARDQSILEEISMVVFNSSSKKKLSFVLFWISSRLHCLDLGQLFSDLHNCKQILVKCDVLWRIFLAYELFHLETVCFAFSPQEVIKLDAVLGLITPIGAQMEYDRERVSRFRIPKTCVTTVICVTKVKPSKLACFNLVTFSLQMNGQKVASGHRQPTVWAPSGTSSKSPVSTPVSEETAPVPSQKHSEMENAPKSRPSTPTAQGIPPQENSSVRFVSSSCSVTSHEYPPRNLLAARDHDLGHVTLIVGLVYMFGVYYLGLVCD